MPKSDASLHSLVTEYLSSPEFEKLAPSSNLSYRQAIDAARERFDWVKIADLEDDGMVKELFGWRDSMRSHPSKTDVTLTVLKTVISWHKRGVKSDPTRCSL